MKKTKLSIIKVGGGVVEDSTSLSQLLELFRQVEGEKLLVHGGGRSATALASELGIETQMVNGRRITDEAMLRVVTMVYAGLVNKRIVAQLQALGVNALGLTGADMGVVHANKRPIKDGVDYGFVGDVDRVDTSILADLLQKGVVPIISPITHNGQGDLLNTNADTIASELAMALSELFEVSLIFCFEKKGVLLDKDDDDSVVHHITQRLSQEMIAQGQIADGMIPKMENSFRALERGVYEIFITHASALTDLDSGTRLTLS